MKFDRKKFNELYHKITLWFFSLGLMIYLLSFNSLHESQSYNAVDLNRPSQLTIDWLENVGERKKFPLLLLSGKITGTQQRYKCRISRGEYEKLKVGDMIRVYETSDHSKILTDYALKNLSPFIPVFGYYISVYVFAEGILFIAMLGLFVFMSRGIYRAYMEKYL